MLNAEDLKMKLESMLADAHPPLHEAIGLICLDVGTRQVWKMVM